MLIKTKKMVEMATSQLNKVLPVSESFKTTCFTPRVDIRKIQELSSHGMSRNDIALKLGLASATVSKALQELKS